MLMKSEMEPQWREVAVSAIRRQNDNEKTKTRQKQNTRAIYC